jgi:hypothetical protein
MTKYFNNLVYIFLNQNVRNTNINHELTKNIDPELIVYRGEETINKPNKSPCDIECYCNWKKDDTAYDITLLFLIRMVNTP